MKTVWWIIMVFSVILCHSKHYVLTMLEASTRWLETYPLPHDNTEGTILDLEKQF